MKLPSKTLERRLFADHDYIIGVDEVGMGCLAGPVVVCAAVFSKKFFQKSHRQLRWLRDSKLLTPKKREEFAKNLLQVSGCKFQICYSYPKTIDRLNIYQAARSAMRRAVKSCVLLHHKFSSYQGRPGKDREDDRGVVLVDGRNKISGLELDQIPVIRGDQKIFSIACASILAKVYRDKMMIRYAKKFPGYGLEKHKGYSTRLHRAQLTNLGPSAIHRRSFAPVAWLL